MDGVTTTKGEQHPSIYREICRFGLAASGSMAVAAAHFLASLLLLHALPAPSFGLFAFQLVAIQLVFGISNALLGAPLSLAMNTPDTSGSAVPFVKASLLLSLAAGILCAALGWAVQPEGNAVGFGIFASVAAQRWFARSVMFARHRVRGAVVSDVTYAVALVAGLLLLLLTKTFSETGAILVLVAASAIAVLPCDAALLLRRLAAERELSLGSYGPIWKTQARWALIGVISTEATSNAHAWLVTLFAGPVSYAPIAAASLLFRPVSLAGTSLTQLERPLMARRLGEGRFELVRSSARRFRLAMVTVWAGTGVLAAGILGIAPGIVVRPEFDSPTFSAAVALWASWSLLFAWRVSDSTLLQAAGRFRPLAKASILSGAISIVAVAIMLVVAEPVLSILAVAMGQVVLGWTIARLMRSMDLSRG